MTLSFNHKGKMWPQLLPFASGPNILFMWMQYIWPRTLFRSKILIWALNRQRKALTTEPTEQDQGTGRCFYCKAFSILNHIKPSLWGHSSSLRYISPCGGNLLLLEIEEVRNFLWRVNWTLTCLSQCTLTVLYGGRRITIMTLKPPSNFRFWFS